MKSAYPALLIVLAALVCASGLQAQSDTVIYVPKYYDPANEELKDIADSLRDIRDSITDAIRDRQEEREEREKEEKKIMRFDVSGIARPESPDIFDQQFHFPPVRQYLTGTCWCFSTTSYLESEVYRITGRKIRLSEMHTVYYEYLDKVRYFMRERGDFGVYQGSESNAVLRQMKDHGLVPLEAYPGVKGDGRHNHAEMSQEIRDFLAMLDDHDYWDEEAAVERVKLILNRYLGTPPASFTFEGKTYTPKEFAENVVRLNPDDYVSIMSTSKQPFYTQGPFEVYDNWWHDSTYYNLPLDEWYAALKNAVTSGYTMTIGGDVSEPGWYGQEDIILVPSFDIPQAYINQDSREYRMYNESTTDDHGVHVVGYTELDGRDWFLIKDSGSSGHWGKYRGYYFMRDDYIRLKMMFFMVHRDALGDVLQTFESR